MKNSILTAKFTSMIMVAILLLVMYNAALAADFTPAGSGNLKKYAVPFIDIGWDATYADMKGYGFTAVNNADGTLSFKSPDIGKPGFLTRVGDANCTLLFTFDRNDKLVSIQGIQMVGSDNNIEQSINMENYFIKAYGYSGTPNRTAEFVDKASQYNYDLTVSDLTKAVAKGKVVVKSEIVTTTTSITVITENINGQCVVEFVVTQIATK